MHKYHVDQIVRIQIPAHVSSQRSADDAYRVVRLLPFDQTGEVSYRVHSAGSGERAVRESDIAGVVADEGLRVLRSGAGV